MDKVLIDTEKDNNNITSDVISLSSDEHYHYVMFKGGKHFRYKKSRLLSFTILKTYSRSEAYIYKGKQSVEFEKVMLLLNDTSGEECLMLVYKGKESFHLKNEFILDLIKSDNTIYLKYFSEIAQITGRLGNDLDTINILINQYKKIGYVSPRTALAVYLERNDIEAFDTIRAPIFPFSYNTSQKSAVQKALNNRMSLIQGPPGTGKTQTILNITANLIMAGKNVAVVSNNNSAIKNVDDKFNANNLSFFSAFLGRNENIRNFINNQSDKPLNLKDWLLKDREYNQLQRKLFKDSMKIDELLVIKTELAQIKKELTGLTIEEHYFLEYKNTDVIFPLIFKSAQKYSDFYFDYNCAYKNGNISFLFKILKSIKYKTPLFSLLQNDFGDINSFVQKQYYRLRKNELNALIEKHTKTIAKADFDRMMKRYTEESMILFKAYLAKRFDGKDSIFSDNDIKHKSAIFIERYPVIFSTSHSLKNCLCDNFIYDYLIVDEASQTDIITGALAMSCAKNIVIVGDTRQLSNIVTSKDRPEFQRIFSKYNLAEGYNHCRYNLMSSIKTLFPKLKENVTLLNEHYRCHPKIIGFCNDRYYNGELIAMTSNEGKSNVMSVYKTVERNNLMRRDADGKKYNPRQVDVIKEEILYQCNNSTAIVTPYRRQVKELYAKIGENSSIEIDTVHKFQGREKDTVIFSTVEDEIDNGFIDEPMVNVAVSRAMKQFFLVIPNNEDNITNTNIKDLVNYIRYNNMEIVESKICSIFDLFYRQYSKRHAKYMIKYKKIEKDDQIAENLIKMLLDELLEMREFSGLSYFRQYPLVTLLKSDYLTNSHTLLTAREKQFASSPFSHNDFLIYNNSNKMAILAIEVDGGKHISDSKQVERDAVKDSIFNKIKIPLLRISTRDSMEKRKIYHKLCEIRSIEPDPGYEDVV